jgi:hypothetical protein
MTPLILLEVDGVLNALADDGKDEDDCSLQRRHPRRLGAGPTRRSCSIRIDRSASAVGVVQRQPAPPHPQEELHLANHELRGPYAAPLTYVPSVKKEN